MDQKQRIEVLLNVINTLSTAYVPNKQQKDSIINAVAILLEKEVKAIM